MELRQIRYCLSICDQGGFSRAAERCGVTQPTLTKAIKALEGEVGRAMLLEPAGRTACSNPELAAEIRASLAEPTR